MLSQSIKGSRIDPPTREGRIDPPTQFYRIVKTTNKNSPYQYTKIRNNLHMEIIPGRDLKFPCFFLIFVIFLCGSTRIKFPEALNGSANRMQYYDA